MPTASTISTNLLSRMKAVGISVSKDIANNRSITQKRT